MRHETPEIRMTAGEWYDGTDSAMFRLYAASSETSVRPLQSRRDFLKLEREAKECIESLSDDFEQWRGPLLEVRKFAEMAADIIRIFEQMRDGTNRLIALGVYSKEVIGLVQSTAYEAANPKGTATD